MSITQILKTLVIIVCLTLAASLMGRTILVHGAGTCDPGVYCAFGGTKLMDQFYFGHQTNVGGNGAMISVQMATVLPEDTAAYWIEISNNQLGEWMQIGYCLGICPPSGGPAAFNSNLQFYVEWKDANGTYAIHLLGGAGWTSPHHFRLWQYYTSAGCSVAFSIDGYQEPYSPLWGPTCGINAKATDAIEDHYLAVFNKPDYIVAVFSGMEYYDCGWVSWASSACAIPNVDYSSAYSDGPVAVVANGNTAFYAYTLQGPIGGSGCGGCRLV
jgi:hypothetical protein